MVLVTQVKKGDIWGQSADLKKQIQLMKRNKKIYKTLT